MIQFTIDTEIERPVADVFAYVTDPDRLSTWQPNTVSAVQEGDGRSGSALACARSITQAAGTSSLSSRSLSTSPTGRSRCTSSKASCRSTPG